MITKESNFGYYNISLHLEEGDHYFIEIRSTGKKPEDWTSVNVSVFDSWYEEIKYSTTFDSDYLWIRTRSKFGIGSLTFSPSGVDEKNKDFVIIHDYVLKKNFKPVIAIFCYPTTEERISSTRSHILSLRGSNLPIYLCSDLELPVELTSLCDGFIYTGPGELCRVPDQIRDKNKYLESNNKYPIHIYPQNIAFYNFHGFINGRGSYLWPAANSFCESTRKLQILGFSHIMLSEGEFELDDLDLKKPEEILKSMWSEEVVLDFFYTPESQYLQCYLWFADLNYLTDSLRDVSIEDKHFPRNTENSNTTAFLLYEKYYMNKLLSNSPEKKIRVRTVEENQDLIKNKYWYTQRTSVSVYKEGDFKLEELGTREKLSFPIYFPNTKKISQSDSGLNSRSDVLGPGSFALDARKYIGSQWIIIIKNLSVNRILDLRVKFFNTQEEVVCESSIDCCLPNTTRFTMFDWDNGDIKKCEYSVYLNKSKTPFYVGEFEYFT